ncbi:MAG: calcium/sodium antiporter [Bdellovibrionales bacterium CG12_big_fil_rev_8_21_14_0_65_38_15]|nr:MAG: calcium/sodium antiporter [Bdellovibrionales bacterium CG22_combo_CG10-13_8_21_14_all_38_13]PIQ52423.1 MAG: calcium/sodium antiporter [Bdellovibrionales bacterium CG12_big_fil_rev_8_21_14_0_65_38_15]PIR29461.1 MAG: calcium/sodium antiporter [Bdellovibrionales bacterium CG11_big_fil_rev_8_21_14_0_20_38_13]
MMIFTISLIVGLIALVWSADKFIDGASSLAKSYGMPPLLIGMVIIGFGTSAPELVVSALAAYQGNPGIALGNAYGSNISNIALILGLTAILMPISVQSLVLKKELPILTIVTLISMGLIYDLELSRLDAVILLGVFCVLMVWTIYEGVRNSKDHLAKEVEAEFADLKRMPLNKAYLYLILGFLLLIISSRILVYGAVGIATAFGISDTIIGLTIVAIGTSLPELASSIIAARKGESDIALGNVIGSNLFNTLAVVGVAGIISPLTFEKEIFSRDVTVMLALTVSLFVFGFGFKRMGRINRVEGSILFVSYLAYATYLISTTI